MSFMRAIGRRLLRAFQELRRDNAPELGAA